VLGEPLDGAALARGVAPLEEDDEPFVVIQCWSLSSSICRARLDFSYALRPSFSAYG
jgi:hypothetical protein